METLDSSEPSSGASVPYLGCEVPMTYKYPKPGNSLIRRAEQIRSDAQSKPSEVATKLQDMADSLQKSGEEMNATYDELEASYKRFDLTWSLSLRKRLFFSGIGFTIVFFSAVAVYVLNDPFNTTFKFFFFIITLPALFLMTLNAFFEYVTGRSFGDADRNPFVGLFWAKIAAVILGLLFIGAVIFTRWLLET